jgi:hypothetical protein
VGSVSKQVISKGCVSIGVGSSLSLANQCDLLTSYHFKRGILSTANIPIPFLLLNSYNLCKSFFPFLVQISDQGQVFNVTCLCLAPYSIFNQQYQLYPIHLDL